MNTDKTIWKFPLKATTRQTLEMPYGATILAVQVQNGNPCLWAEVTPSAPLQKREFLIYSTGDLITDHGPYVGTFQHELMVFHIFEAPRVLPKKWPFDVLQKE